MTGGVGARPGDVQRGQPRPHPQSYITRNLMKGDMAMTVPHRRGFLRKGVTH